MSGGSIEITPVDPTDEAEIERWNDVAEAVSRDTLGAHATPWSLPEVVAELRDTGGRVERRVFVAREAGSAEVVGAAKLAVPLLDNLDSASVGVDVLPAARRRGIGTALLARLEQEARDRGRTRLDAEFSWPEQYGTDGTGWHGVEFARTRGFRLAIGDVQRELDLPVDDALLDQLAAEAATRHHGYTLRTFVGAVPDDIAETWVAMWASLMTEAPMGEKEMEPEVATVASMREEEALLDRQGRTLFHAVALDAGGAVVAFSDIATPAHDRTLAFQWGTLVHRDARGHRLGLAVKVANLRLLQQERDDVRRMVTWNAEVNHHMIGVNERLGFRPVARMGEFQKRLT